VTVAVTSTAAGAPTASYDPDNKVLTIDIEADGSTNANQIIAALGAVPEFTATLDTSDEGANSGLGVIGAFTDANFASTGNSGGEPGTLFINIEAGVSTAQQVADAINAEGTFAAANDHFDATSEALAGKGAVDATATAVTSGGSGIAGDNSPVQVVAQLAAQGNGIELVDDSPFGADSQGNPRSVKVLNHQSSQAAVDLGFVAKGETESSTTIPGVAAAGDADLTGENTDITFTARNAGTPLNGVQVEFVNNAAIGDQALVSYDAGTRTLTIDVEFGTTSANTVIDAVNGQAGGLFSAALSTAAGENTGQGTIDAADTGVVATLSGGTADVLTAADRNPLETEGVFNTLHRLQQALLENDTVAIERMLKSLDDDMLRLNFGRAEAGARQQSLATLQIRLENEEVELTSALSKEIDVDFTEAISNFTARQAALEASLRTAGSVLQLTLLNFI